MLEKYIKLKEKYPKSVIIIKSGNFYDCINDDAIIINKLFSYKIKELSKYVNVMKKLIKIINFYNDIFISFYNNIYNFLWFIKTN